MKALRLILFIIPFLVAYAIFSLLCLLLFGVKDASRIADAINEVIR